MAAASEGEAAALRAAVTVLQQRVSRLEALVTQLQGQLAKVKKG